VTDSWVTTGSWETLYVGGVTVPGVTLVDVKLPDGLDVQKPKGGKKATISDEGAPPVVLSCETTLNTIEEVTDFVNQVKPLFRPPSKGASRDPLEIAHPQAQLWDVHAVTAGEIDAPSPRAGGSYVVRYTLIQWAPAPEKTKESKKKPRDNKNANTAEQDIDGLIASRKPSATATP